MSLSSTSSSSDGNLLSLEHISAPTFQSPKQVMNQIRRLMKSCNRVAFYAFNVREDELELACALLNRWEGGKSMRITYNDDYNFIVKYMPGVAHEGAHSLWLHYLSLSLLVLAGGNAAGLGYMLLGAAEFTLSPGRKKQADASICPMTGTASTSPTVVLEVGDSESLSQLQIDARLWLESTLLNVQLVIVISIDPPVGPFPNPPRIIIQHWKSFPPTRPPTDAEVQPKVAHMVWQADWTHGVTPNYYVPLVDIFPAGIPPVYGGATQAVFDPACLALWRQQIMFT